MNIYVRNSEAQIPAAVNMLETFGNTSAAAVDWPVKRFGPRCRRGAASGTEWLSQVLTGTIHAFVTASSGRSRISANGST